MLFLGDNTRCYGEDVFCHSQKKGRWHLCYECLMVFLLSRLAVVIIPMQILTHLFLCRFPYRCLVPKQAPLPSWWARCAGIDMVFQHLKKQCKTATACG